MVWEVFKAKNNELTMSLNGISIYSKYNPQKNAAYWIKQELDTGADCYILIGLGLGYHLKALLDEVSNKKIIVYYFDKKEYEIFLEYNAHLQENNHVLFVNDLQGIVDMSHAQVLIPNVWINAIGWDHPLHNLLETIRLKQVSYKRAEKTMLENFLANIELGDWSIEKSSRDRMACLVASGPSLNETIHWLKNIENEVDVFIVGSALKVAEYYEIMPKGVVHADASALTLNQFQNIKYNGDLYYLSTANHSVVANHRGSRFILLQEGYSKAESYGNKKRFPLLQTGGSVGTVAFSLIEALGYESIILFGQDLGFSENETHISQSTSNEIMNSERLRKVLANDGSYINTNAGLSTFLNWYNLYCKESTLNIYNTAKKGAKIENVPLITERQLYDLVKKSS